MSVSTRNASGIDFVQEYIKAAERFSLAIARTDLRAAVPACPTWSVYDVVVHLGNTHAWAATIVETSRRAPAQHDAPPSRRSVAVGRWYAGKAEDLYQVLRSADPQGECWNFAGVNPVAAFWARRQTHETVMHSVDLDQAAGRRAGSGPPGVARVSGRLAADGIAEVLDVFLPRMHVRGKRARLTQPLTLRATDTGHVWTLQPREDGPPFVAVRTEPGADLVEGPAVALWQLLWKRAPADHPEVSYVGNRDRIAAFMSSPLTP